MSIHPTKQALHSEEMRQRILSVSEEMIRTYGYDAVSVRDIAGQLNVTTGTLYHYFSNKDALMVAIFEKHETNLQEVFERYLDAVDPLQAVQDFLCGAMIEQVYEDGYPLTQYRTLRAMRGTPRKGNLEKRTRILVQRALDAGQFRPEYTAEMLSDFLVSVYRGAVYFYAITSPETDLRALIQQRMGLALTGLCTEKN